jgi:hypothetical protein
MSYEKQNFVDGNVLYADNLNKIEDELVTKSSVYVQVMEPADAENGDLWVLSIDDNIVDDPEPEEPEATKSVQSDWAENDSEAPSFIKNRPFYENDDNTVKKLDAKFMPIHVSAAEPDVANEGDLWISVNENSPEDEVETVVVTGDWNENNPSSMSYIKNRTHWEELIGEEIIWDGNITGRTVVMMADNTHMVKISDLTPVRSDFAASASRLTQANGGHTNIIATNIEDVSNGYHYDNKFIVVRNTPCIVNDVSFPETGIYVSYIDKTTYVKAVRYGEMNVHKIDPKYLPETAEENSAEVFVQSAEPTDAAVGDIWVDTSAQNDGIPAIIYLASSTPGSSKVFALRVYDDGELSIIEEGGTN